MGERLCGDLGRRDRHRPPGDRAPDVAGPCLASAGHGRFGCRVQHFDDGDGTRRTQTFVAETSVRATWRDYLALTKPVIVVLLLVTTLAGMVVGAGTVAGGEA